MQASPPLPLRMSASRYTRPVRVGIVVLTFSFGGSETETIELVRGCDPREVRFTGIAVGRPQPLPPGEPPADGTFPPLVLPPNPGAVDPSDPRVRIVPSFAEAARQVAERSDVLLSWGVHALHEVLPLGPLPKLVIQSKDSGEWARGFGYPNALLTPHLVANSTTAAAAFPPGARPRVTVIHDGINPDRVTPRLSRTAQRAAWDLRDSDLVVGYHGRIEHDKGVGKIADALALLPDSWIAVFVGVNPNSRFTATLREYCEQVLPGRYRLLPWSHDIGSVLGGFDVFCQPSQHEGFSNSLAEAWLAGVPTVYTAATGALPDLGELGVPVDPDAGGAEVAAALRQAVGDAEMATTAQQVIQHRFTVAQHVDQWTRHLLRLHDAPRAQRVLLVSADDPGSQHDLWRQTCEQLDTPIDVCGVACGGLPHGAPVYLSHYDDGCPLFRANSVAQLLSVARYTRPDLVLTLPGGLDPTQVADQLGLPVLVTTPRPWADERNWTRWLAYLAVRGDSDVYR